MQKILKLSTVSILAVMTANGAHAAGYTCEELIEYTSCNAGYYLSVCPDGYSYFSKACYESGGVFNTETQSECENEIIGTWYGAGCANINENDYVADSLDFNFIPTTSTKSCWQCQAGTYCANGATRPTTCPAGSYCATAGLSAVTGVCAVGSFAGAGATECTSCPVTQLTDINGNTVSATTASTGSTHILACIVTPDAEFADDKGIYHFKSDCSYSPASYPATVIGECIEGYSYVIKYSAGGSEEVGTCYAISQEECNANNNELATVPEEDLSWQNGHCICASGGWQIGNGKPYCPH